jgi:hypothetical protein
MKLEQQEFNLKIKIKEPKPTAVDLSEADISSLIQFFQTLDEWDRQSSMTSPVDGKRSSHDSQPVSG